MSDNENLSRRSKIDVVNESSGNIVNENIHENKEKDVRTVLVYGIKTPFINESQIKEGDLIIQGVPVVVTVEKGI